MNRSGLTLVELLVAMVILTVGILGMAAGTGWMIRSVDLTRIDTGRAAATQAGIETVKSAPFAGVGTGSVQEGDFTVSWSVLDEAPNWKLMRFVVVGPGRASGTSGARAAISTAVADTIEYRVNRP
jgi:prepilin-type N-terminal cleavage/methylation domain-containing protein